MARLAPEQDVDRAIHAAYDYVKTVLPKIEAIGNNPGNKNGITPSDGFTTAQLSQVGLPLIMGKLDLRDDKPPLHTAQVAPMRRWLPWRRRHSTDYYLGRSSIITSNLGTTKWELMKFNWRMGNARRKVDSYIGKRSR